MNMNIKKILTALIISGLAYISYAGEAVMVNTNGVLTYPANFKSTNDIASAATVSNLSTRTTTLEVQLPAVSNTLRTAILSESNRLTSVQTNLQYQITTNTGSINGLQSQVTLLKAGVATNLWVLNTGSTNAIGFKAFGTNTLALRSSDDIEYRSLIVDDLTVIGTSTIVNTEIVDVNTNYITLNANLTNASPVLDATFQVERGTSADAQLYWNESIGRWMFGTYGDLQDTTLYVSNHNVEVADLKASTNNIQSQVTINTTNLAQQVSRIGTAEADITALEAATNNLQSQVTINTTNLATQVTRIGTAESSITALQGATNNIQSQVTTISTNLDAQIVKITNHEARVSILETNTATFAQGAKADTALQPASTNDCITNLVEGAFVTIVRSGQTATISANPSAAVYAETANNASNIVGYSSYVTNIMYLSPNGSDSNDGLKPWTPVQTWTNAMTKLSSVTGRWILNVAPAIYTETAQPTLNNANISLLILGNNSKVVGTLNTLYIQGGATCTIQNCTFDSGGYGVVANGSATRLYLNSGEALGASASVGGVSSAIIYVGTDFVYTNSFLASGATIVPMPYMANYLAVTGGIMTAGAKIDMNGGVISNACTVVSSNLQACSSAGASLRNQLGQNCLTFGAESSQSVMFSDGQTWGAGSTVSGNGSIVTNVSSLSSTNAYRLSTDPIYADSEYITEARAQAIISELAGAELFGATNAHPVVTGAGWASFWLSTPPAQWTNSYALTASATNMVGNRYMTNELSGGLNAGWYRHTVYADKSGPMTVNYQSYLVYSDGTTTNYIGTPTTVTIGTTTKQAYESATYVSTNISLPVGTNKWYLGVVRRAVAGAGGVTTLNIYGGTNTPTHLETPSLSFLATTPTLAQVLTSGNTAGTNINMGGNSVTGAVSYAFNATSGATNMIFKPVAYTLNSTNYYGVEWTVYTNASNISTTRYPVVILP